MKIYRQNEKIEYTNPCIALGNFDGLHMGHLKVIDNARRIGDSFGVCLFDVHSSNSVKILTSLEDKLSILEDIGADFAVIVEFNEAFRNKSLTEFAEFIKNIGAKFVSVGYDYRCAKCASADSIDLKNELGKLGIGVIISEPVEKDGLAVKSTLIRELIEEGNITKANKLLTRPFSICGKVTKGKQNGRLIGFPTANIEPESGRIIPNDGVYVGECVIDKAYPVILNIGKNPTFDASKRTIEAHIIDFSGDIYGCNLSLKLFERIRDCIRFNSVDELAKQLEKDRQYALKMKGRI